MSADTPPPEDRRLKIPNLSLVLLMGASGSGKSTFAAKHFHPSEVISSDRCRGLVSGDENDQSATGDAFEVLQFIAAKRLARGLLTVIDATNVDAVSRKPLVQLAKQYHCIPVAVVLKAKERVCHARNAERADRAFGKHVVKRQTRQLRTSMGSLRREGFRYVHVLDGPDEVERARIDRVPTWSDKRHETGPFDIIGDVHGCFDELVELLGELNYVVTPGADELGRRRFDVAPPEGRRALFLGDLVDRGPNSPDVLRLVMNMCADGSALCVPGNHDVKLSRALSGRAVRRSHGLAETMEQLERESPEFLGEVRAFIERLVSHLVLDDGRLVAVHAGLREDMQGRASGRVRSYCLYGDTTGETDVFGLPVRYPWARDYRGSALVVYGHTPVLEPEWVNETICLDTGCVFGGTLTALRYPERELVSAPAAREYYAPVRPPIGAGEASGPDDVLDLDDVTGKRRIELGAGSIVRVGAQESSVALEVMSRFTVDPRWLVYLPPTMSPPETSSEEGYLEHPAEALRYYAGNGVATVVCQEKHMGSRAVVVVCRDEAVAAKRFGDDSGRTGVVITRTGRPFFRDHDLETALLARVRAAADKSGVWGRLASDWMVIDAELMPWSTKAGELIRSQYASVGAAARASLAAGVAALEQAAGRAVLADDLSLAEWIETARARRDAADRFTDAYGRYCWDTDGLEGVRLAPFHLLASEGRVHSDQDHFWHLSELAELAAADPELIVATRHLRVELGDADSEAAAVTWWREMTEAGGEGMVVKPRHFIALHKGRLVQPAVKCRGRDYLRIIYGPDYDAVQNLVRLRKRSLGRKRRLAHDEFRLGLAALERFVACEPLRRIHECVFAILAKESETIDPRL